MNKYIGKKVKIKSLEEIKKTFDESVKGEFNKCNGIYFPPRMYGFADSILKVQDHDEGIGEDPEIFTINTWSFIKEWIDFEESDRINATDETHLTETFHKLESPKIHLNLDGLLDQARIAEAQVANELEKSIGTINPELRSIAFQLQNLKEAYTRASKIITKLKEY